MHIEEPVLQPSSKNKRRPRPPKEQREQEEVESEYNTENRKSTTCRRLKEKNHRSGGLSEDTTNRNKMQQVGKKGNKQGQKLVAGMQKNRR